MRRLQARSRCEYLQRDAEDAQLEGQRTELLLSSGPTFKKTSLATHVMLWSAVFFTSAFHSSLPSLQQKLLASVIIPVRPCLMCQCAAQQRGSGPELYLSKPQVILVYFLVQTKTRHSFSTVGHWFSIIFLALSTS